VTIDGEPTTIAGSPAPPTVAPRRAVLGHSAGDGAGRRIPIAGLLRTAAVVIFVYLVYAQSRDFISVLSLSAIWGVAAVGLGLVLGSAGQISLCQASFVLAGAYFYGTVTTEWGGSTALALVASAGGGALIALIVSPVLRARGNYLALATIAVALLIDRIVTTGDWIPGGNGGITGVPSLELLGLQIQTAEQYLVFTSVLLAVIIAVLHWRYGRGPARRAIQALHHDEGVLAGFGGNPWLLKREIFVVGGLLGGLAGGLYGGAFGYVSNNGFGLFESFALALAVFIGGEGRLMGALFGALVYQGSFTILGQDSDYRFALLGAVVIVTVHFFPRGLWPSREDFRGWLPKRRRRHQEADAGHHELDPIEPLSLEVAELTKSYGALKAVDGVTLRFAPGSLTALIGPNGAGKTTMLDLVAADQPASAGWIVIGGRDVTTSTRVARARLGIARTYQRLRLISSLSVLDNVMLGVDQAARREGVMTDRERRRRAEAALIDVGLGDRHDAAVGSLTFGQRRLVEMARAIASRPRLVLLDEPSSGLNDSEIEDFADVVRRLHGTGCTIVLVEHNLPFVRSLAQDIIALDRGRLLAHGATEEVFASPEFQRSYVGVTEEPGGVTT
jgi:ABC-type branched-subunit amino acid transport system ATPase component/ABC-type branched-subunit amino acid transport system permease subunit